MTVQCPRCGALNIIGSATHYIDGITRRKLTWHCYKCGADLAGLPEYHEPEMPPDERDIIIQRLARLRGTANNYVEGDKHE
jgi:hypothetical protein